MELHAVDRFRAVLQTHDSAVVQPSGDFEVVWKSIAVDNQRMIACGGQRRGQVFEDAFAIVVHLAEFTVNDVIGAHDFATKGLSDGLMAKADAQKRSVRFGGGFGQGKANACLVGVTWTGAKDDAAGIKGHCRLNIERIIAVNRAFGPQFAQEMNQVEGEAVVIVDQKQHFASLAPRSADMGCQALKAPVYLFRGVSIRQGTRGI